MNAVHLILSNDHSYNTGLIRKLTAQYKVRPDSVDTLDGKTTDVYGINNALYTDSLIAQNRAVIINNAEALKPDSIGAIVKFAASPEGTTLLMMVSGNADAFRQGKYAALGASKNIRKHTITGKSAAVFIQDYVKEHATKITAAAAGMLADILETATWGIIEQEMDKLSTYAGKDGTIDETAVSELTFNLDRSDTFQFVSELLGQKDAAALRDLARMQEAGADSTMVIGAILWKLRQMIAANPRNAALRRRMERIYEYSLALRTGTLRGPLALDLMTIELLRRKLY